jgi:hypothetical protein
MSQSTISLGDRILAVRCLALDCDYQLADLARSYLLAQQLISAPVVLRRSSGEPLDATLLDATLLDATLLDESDSMPPLISDSESDDAAAPAAPAPVGVGARPWTPYNCPCSCHCGEYECSECYEPIESSTEEMEAPELEASADCAASQSEHADQAPSAAPDKEPAPEEPAPDKAPEKETVLRLFPADAPLEQMDGIVLRLRKDGVEMLRVEHRETSLYVFWTQQRVEAQSLGQLTVKPVEPL